MKKFFVGLIIVFGAMIVWTASVLLMSYVFPLFDKTIVSWIFLILIIGFLAYISNLFEENEKDIFKKI
ncbi:MAG: hypothetical protein HW400_777 [Candidatus Levybacteria bacterium]|nr:hypothetical protein [Candidatus Levybacteria bacterium]